MTLAVKVTPAVIPRVLVRSAIAAEFLSTCGLTDTVRLRGIQQLVSEGLISGLVVIASERSAFPRERYCLRFDTEDSQGNVSLQVSNGKSHTEALDVELAAAFTWIARRVSGSGYSPYFHIEWSTAAKADSDRLAEACRRTGIPMVTWEDASGGPAQPQEWTPPSRTASPSASSYSAASSSSTYTSYSSPVYRSAAASPSYTSYSAPAPRPTPPPPSPPSTHHYVTVVDVIPEKDKGIRLTAEIAARRRT